jgi:hypothetical protein
LVEYLFSDPGREKKKKKQFEKTTRGNHMFRTNATGVLPDLPQKSLDL